MRFVAFLLPLLIAATLLGLRTTHSYVEKRFSEELARASLGPLPERAAPIYWNRSTSPEAIRDP